MSAYFFESLCSFINQGIISRIYHATGILPGSLLILSSKSESRYTGTTIRDRINNWANQGNSVPKGSFLTSQNRTGEQWGRPVNVQWPNIFTWVQHKSRWSLHTPCPWKWYLHGCTFHIMQFAPTLSTHRVFTWVHITDVVVCTHPVRVPWHLLGCILHVVVQHTPYPCTGYLHGCKLHMK